MSTEGACPPSPPQITGRSIHVYIILFNEKVQPHTIRCMMHDNKDQYSCTIVNDHSESYITSGHIIQLSPKPFLPLQCVISSYSTDTAYIWLHFYKNHSHYMLVYTIILKLSMSACIYNRKASNGS